MGGAFLHSPLLDELKSLELMLLRQARKKSAPLEATASRSQARPPSGFTTTESAQGKAWTVATADVPVMCCIVLIQGHLHAHGALAHSALRARAIVRNVLEQRTCASLKICVSSWLQETAAPPQTRISLEMSVHGPDGQCSTERMELPVLPSMAVSAPVAQHYERGPAPELASAQDKAATSGPASELSGTGVGEPAATQAEAVATNEAATQEVLMFCILSIL